MIGIILFLIISLTLIFISIGFKLGHYINYKLRDESLGYPLLLGIIMGIMPICAIMSIFEFLKIR